MTDSQMDQFVADFTKACITDISAYMEHEYSMKLPIPSNNKKSNWQYSLQYCPEYEKDIIRTTQITMATQNCAKIYAHNMFFWHKVAKRLSKFLMPYFIKNPIYALPENLDAQNLKQLKKNNFKNAEEKIVKALTDENPFCQKIKANVEKGHLKKKRTRINEKSANRQIHNDVMNEFNNTRREAFAYRFGHKKSR